MKGLQHSAESAAAVTVSINAVDDADGGYDIDSDDTTTGRCGFSREASLRMMLNGLK